MRRMAGPLALKALSNARLLRKGKVEVSSKSAAAGAFFVVFVGISQLGTCRRSGVVGKNTP
jgi:hypothetical protein